MRYRVHLTIAVIWGVSIIPAWLWWRDSVLFVIFASVFANVYAAVSALEAADDSDVLAELRSLRAAVINPGSPLSSDDARLRAMTQQTGGAGAGRPAASASKSEWVEHVVATAGVDRATAEGLTKEELVQRADDAQQGQQQGQPGQTDQGQPSQQ